MMKNERSFNIDPNARNSDGKTGLQISQHREPWPEQFAVWMGLLMDSGFALY